MFPPAGTRTDRTDFSSFDETFVDLLQLGSTGSSLIAHTALAGEPPSTSSTLPPPPPSPELPLLPASSPLPSALTTDWYGVWTRGDANSDRSGFPFKGIEFQGTWSEIEAADGVFNWTAIDAILTFAADQGLYVLLSVNVGPDSPGWLYSKGVPQVFTDGHEKEAGPYPYYLNSLYISRFNRLVEKLGQYTRGLPSRLFERIAYVQVKTGSTGDEEAYKGNVKKVSAAFDIDERNFTNFRLAAFKQFHAAFQLGTRPVIPLMFAKLSNDNEPENPYQALLDWIIATVRVKWGTKMNGSGQGYQLNGERWRTKRVLPHVVDPAPGEYDLFTRCEMDQGWKRGGIFPINNKQAFYWTMLSALHSGLTMWNIAVSAVEWHRAEKYWEDFEFFNKYAGQTRGAEATGAFCALREGLDTSDTNKFPVTIYGGASGTGLQRFNERAVKIVSSRAARGAKIDDLAGASKGMMFQRKEQTGLNDVGEEVFRGNYERFLTQINPDDTSVGLWRVGGIVTTTSSVYGRFARRFDHASGKNTMVFRLTDSFFSGGRLAGAYSVSVRVMYFDEGFGKWALCYDALGDPNKRAYDVVKTDTKQWKEKVVTLADANFGKSGPMGSDLSLVNLDADDDIFHMVEITRPLAVVRA